MKLKKTILMLVAVVFSGMIMLPSGGNCQGFSVTTPTAQNLKALWGISDRNVFSAGDLGTILKFDGSSWAPQTSGTVFDLRALWVGPSGTGFTAFSAGTSGTILSNSGSGWNQALSPTDNNINAIWGSSVSNVFAVGDQGVILHFDGNTWSEMASTGTAGINLFSVWGISGNNVYAGGIDGNLFHFNGSAWLTVSGIPTTEDIKAIWGSSASDIFLAGTFGDIIHFDGQQWTLQDSADGFSLNALWGDSSGDVFAAGQTGKILHFDGTSWTEITPLGISFENINAIWGSPSGKVFFAAQAGDILLLSRTDTFSPMVLSSIPSDGRTNVSATSAITFQFSKAMDPTTINTTSITLTAGSASITGKVALSGDGMIATFTPSSALADSTSYKATVSSGVKDVSGNTLKSSFSITFTTVGSASGGGSSGGGNCFISCACR
ncbi:MAG TPA: Ig-like domain-containing protein [Desulfomonilia bacterium]|nr:Ig-like domain-containing protein [Desulfomonilia bacterium]